MNHIHPFMCLFIYNNVIDVYNEGDHVFDQLLH